MTKTTLIFPLIPLYNKRSYKYSKSIQMQITYRMTLVQQHIKTTNKSIERGLRYGP